MTVWRTTKQAAQLDVHRTLGGGWLHRPAPRPDALANLFCFPHAGGTASAFRLWPLGLPSWMEVMAVQPPGRANRWSEPAISSMPVLVDALATVLSEHTDKPFAIFGHSMGAVVAHQVALAMKRQIGAVPFHLFVSGRRPPHVPGVDPPLHRMPDDEFVREINRRYGGIPTEVAGCPDVLALLLPALRADIAALETFRPDDDEPLQCPISAFGGAQDRLTPRAHLEAWGSRTEGPFRVRVFHGGHFYLDAQRDAVLADVSATLALMQRHKTTLEAMG